MKYVPALDGLRAVAVLAVIVFHCWPALLPGGHVGVDIFFALSGFLITSILASEWSATGRINLTNFYWRRLLRLAPALYFMLLFVVAIMLVRNNPSWGEPLIAGIYLMNWSRALGWGFDGMVGHTWSLAIEEQFYLLWPVLLWLVLRVFGDQSWKAALALVAGVVAWRLVLFDGTNLDRVYNGFDTRADALLAGCVVALAPAGRWQDAAFRLWIVPALVLVVFILTLDHMAGWLYSFGFTFLAFASAWIVIVLARSRNFLTDFLSTRTMVGMGRISYAMYLWHYPILWVLNRGIEQPAMLLAICLAATIAISTFSYLFVESPALRWRGSLGDSAVHRPATH